ncbi:helix-turn-helix domain-containing protein [Chiayiivirga flava]|uniref:Transcriptional regulator with XRE-family HTH domain n=1 Tax=Chiayiivirga flava TaxID=659595 RepID=A0A7W8G272_9GAMM|nr:helix-turn-helix transcriptional regulator [Chiayiivirga flava]MBB5209648.1 transcriptional regulator with XRE-family HTH domain [Chiayiivirga flava]
MPRSIHRDDYQTLLQLLRDLRVGQGMTQVDLGHALDNTQTFVSKIERGERRIDVLEFIDICEAMNVDPVSAFKQFMTQRGVPAPAGKRRR